MTEWHVPSSRIVRVGLALCLVLVAGQLHAPTANAAAWTNSLGLDARYEVDAQLSWAQRRLTVTSSATVTNTTDHSFGDLTFNLVPSELVPVQITETSVDGTPVTFTRDGQNLGIDLPAQLPVGGRVNVRIAYSASFTSSFGGSRWMFALASRTATAYRWIPWLSQRNEFTDIGDPFPTAISPEVRVTITADQPVVFATTGRLVSTNGLSQTFRATNVPDFNFTASPDYRVKKITTGGVEVRVYWRTLAPDKLVYWTKKALRRFTARVGPYAYGTLSVAETPGGFAMESPGHIWIPATSRSSVLPYRIVHEVAHQWFYAAVGNNQVWQPFADEAVAEFLARDLLGHRQPRCARARLDLSIYDYGTTCYYDVIYAQGDRFLNDYRLRVGNDRFWAGLRDYYADYRFRAGSTRKLLDALDEASGWTGGHEDRFPSLY